MSISLTPKTLVATIGVGDSVSWAQMKQTPTLTQVSNGVTDNIILHNESGVGINVTWADTTSSFHMAAGEWRQIPLTPNAVSFNYVVEYIVSGILSGTNAGYLLVTYFAPGEPVHAPLQLGNSPVSSASQQRVLSIPMVPETVFSGFQGFTNGQVFSPFPGTLVTYNPSADGVSFAVVYIYYLSIYCSGTVTPQSAGFTIDVLEQNNSHVTTATHQIYFFHLARNDTTGTETWVQHTGPSVIKARFRPAATTGSLVLQISNGNVLGGGTFNLYYNIGIDVDVINGDSPPAIGGGSSGRTTPTVYNAGGTGLY